MQSQATPAIDPPRRTMAPTNSSPGKLESTFQVSPKPNINSCLGYGGYVPSIKSENVFGQTYGKTSYAASSGQIVRGLDLPAHLRFNSSMKSEFVNLSERWDQVETTAQLVGVNKGDTCFKKVSLF
jgi:hypothetical protein